MQTPMKHSTIQTRIICYFYLAIYPTGSFAQSEVLIENPGPWRISATADCSLLSPGPTTEKFVSAWPSDQPLNVSNVCGQASILGTLGNPGFSLIVEGAPIIDPDFPFSRSRVEANAAFSSVAVFDFDKQLFTANESIDIAVDYNFEAYINENAIFITRQGQRLLDGGFGSAALWIDDGDRVTAGANGVRVDIPGDLIDFVQTDTAIGSLSRNIQIQQSELSLRADLVVSFFTNLDVRKLEGSNLINNPGNDSYHLSPTTGWLNSEFELGDLPDGVYCRSEFPYIGFCSNTESPEIEVFIDTFVLEDVANFPSEIPRAQQSIMHRTIEAEQRSLSSIKEAWRAVANNFRWINIVENPLKTLQNFLFEREIEVQTAPPVRIGSTSHAVRRTTDTRSSTTIPREYFSSGAVAAGAGARSNANKLANDPPDYTFDYVYDRPANLNTDLSYDFDFTGLYGPTFAIVDDAFRHFNIGSELLERSLVAVERLQGALIVRDQQAIDAQLKGLNDFLNRADFRFNKSQELFLEIERLNLIDAPVQRSAVLLEVQDKIKDGTYDVEFVRNELNSTNLFDFQISQLLVELGDLELNELPSFDDISVPRAMALLAEQMKPSSVISDLSSDITPPLTCNGFLITVNTSNGEIPTIGSDVILGTPGPDTINALGGNDTICGEGGDDIINAGGGADWVDAGPGDDEIQGSGGNDMIFGGMGNDVIRGGGGDDDIYGEDGDDSLLGQTGDDTIDGGDGVDDISGGAGSDTIYTGSGATVGSGVFVSGGGGNDTIHGGADADDLRGTAGVDIINGSGGDDLITGGTGRDEINGGDGDDDIRGQGSRDTINGDAGNDTINGGDENDIVNGGDGNDHIAGGPGNDILRGDSGADTVSGGLGDDTLVGGPSGGDICIGQSGTDTAAGSCESVTGVP